MLRNPQVRGLAPRCFSASVCWPGFFSSKVGVADLGYLGNRVVAEWNGAPDEVLRKLGVSYEP